MLRSKNYYIARGCLNLGRTTRKLASYGIPLFDEIYQKFIKHKIKSDYADIISEYQAIDYKPIPQTGNYPIWIFWWQGIDKMPEVVRICYNSVLENAGEHPVNVITEDNYKEYLSKAFWLEDIISWLDKGHIGYAYFSDIVRCYLIYTYGGIWIDATVLLTDKIDNVVNNSFFATGRRVAKTKHEYKKLPSPAKGKWTGYFVFSCKGNPLFQFIDDVLISQIKRNGFNMEYLMIDYCFVTAYEIFSFVKEIQEKSPIFPNAISMLIGCLNDEFDEGQYKSLKKTNPFLKLTYKRKWFEQTSSHKLTYYGYLKNRYL